MKRTFCLKLETGDLLRTATISPSGSCVSLSQMEACSVNPHPLSGEKPLLFASREDAELLQRLLDGHGIFTEIFDFKI